MIKEALGITSLEFSIPLLLFSVTDLNERLHVFFLFSIFALRQLLLFSRENLRANLARGRPKFIPLRIPYA